MKKTIKLFMIAVALLISGNLFAQSASSSMTVTQYQTRLHDLKLCRNYLSTVLTEKQLSSVDQEMVDIAGTLQSLNASPLSATPLDNYLVANAGDADVMAYIKILALYNEPNFLLGRSLTPAEKTTYENVLASRAAALNAMVSK